MSIGDPNKSHKMGVGFYIKFELIIFTCLSKGSLNLCCLHHEPASSLKNIAILPRVFSEMKISWLNFSGKI